MSHDRHDSKEDGGVRRLHGLRVAVGMSVGSAASALSARRAVIAGIVYTTEAGVGAPEKVRHIPVMRLDVRTYSGPAVSSVARGQQAMTPSALATRDQGAQGVTRTETT